MGYLHVEITACQTSKKAGQPCGDQFAIERSAAATTIILADGLGSGIRANLAATMCISRFRELLKQGVHLREAFARIVKTMNTIRRKDLMYTAFCVARILNNGLTTVLCYDMPAPLFATGRYVSVLKQRTQTIEGGLVAETDCQLKSGEGLLMVCDGITQAGMGRGFVHGWELNGVEGFATDRLAGRVKMKDLPGLIHDQARKYWGTGHGDDCTVLLASCRPGEIVNLFSGPPVMRQKDREICRSFLNEDGIKIVCGATTAKIVARQTGKELTVEQETDSLIAPPQYAIKGIDLVTEGAVTLNQVYNILEEDARKISENSGVTSLYDFLNIADRINLYVGQSVNPASADISFRQRGILSRRKIISLLYDKLNEMGKTVVLKEF